MCYMYEQTRTILNGNCANLFVGVEDRTFYVFNKVDPSKFVLKIFLTENYEVKYKIYIHNIRRYLFFIDI